MYNDLIRRTKLVNGHLVVRMGLVKAEQILGMTVVDTKWEDIRFVLFTKSKESVEEFIERGDNHVSIIKMPPAGRLSLTVVKNDPG